MTNTQINDVQGAAVTKRRRRRSGSLQKLKSERVQQALPQMPGWRLSENEEALERVKVFHTRKMATTFVAFVAQNAVEADQAVDLRIVRREVALTLHGTCRTGLPSILTERTLQFAKGVA